MTIALKSGMLAYIDSFAGLVPCKVIQITPVEDVLQAGGLEILVKVTATRPGYHADTLHYFYSKIAVIPRDAVYGMRRMSGPRVLPYDVIADGAEQ